ncbi:MAG: hypothetical protein DMG32_01740 [Acidobacteria bacterium]|nr:MAG: hypothetical protein DMG32_01740 [Acidobacteriota bacterium]
MPPQIKLLDESKLRHRFAELPPFRKHTLSLLANRITPELAGLAAEDVRLVAEPLLLEADAKIPSTVL